ncbi:MAG: glutamate carboxypeptidase [Solirubrobacteraceae bacterium]|nr:glutamate carboxypeptidase [Solirubrobacteraceae bacterium]
MDPWVAEQAERIAARAKRELEALVGVSSPSGDVAGAEECAAVCAALLPDEATVERPTCSSPDHAPDLIARVTGTGTARVVLLGHLDTVVAHANHQPLRAQDGKLYGSGAVDMKGGDVLALGVLRALTARPELYGELALLLVCDEEWRTAPFGHAEAFAGWEACLCFEAGETTEAGEDAVVVRRKGAGTLHVRAHGRAAHSGSAPDAGRNALLALSRVAQAVATRHDPGGEHRLTAVPTILNSGEAFNVVPGHGELYCDLRADEQAAFDDVLNAVPEELDGVRLERHLLRVWPGMDAREADAPALAAATRVLGRPLHGHARGGASDASHFASVIPVTIDGLGPRGGAAHNPGEFVLERSLHERAEVALAVALAVLTPSA